MLTSVEDLVGLPWSGSTRRGLQKSSGLAHSRPLDCRSDRGLSQAARRELCLRITFKMLALLSVLKWRRGIIPHKTGNERSLMGAIVNRDTNQEISVRLEISVKDGYVVIV